MNNNINFSGEELITQILKPVVRIRAKKAVGSGTIINSEEDTGTYIVTNHHVVEDCIEYKEVWDELLRRPIKKEFCSTVEVDISRLDNRGIVKGLITSIADIIINNKQQDLALLRLRDDSIYTSVFLYPEDKCENIPILVPLACCGAAMGEKPVVTFGHLNGMQIEIDNFDYNLSSAPSIFGNSGGAVFTPYENIWHYCGVPSRIRVAILGWAADAITHMGYFIPISRVYKWLRDNCYEFIWDKSVTKEECDNKREQKRERELAVALTKEK